MRNLFIVHTQYTLFIALGLVNNRFFDDENDIVIFPFFEVKNNLIPKLNQYFNIVYINKDYAALYRGNGLHRFYGYQKICNSTKKIINQFYDQVFITIGMKFPEIKLMKHLYHFNNKIEFNAIEDGSYPYFLNYVSKKGLIDNNTTGILRKLLFKYVLGCGKFYSFDGNYMGSNTWLKNIYLTYKDHTRDIYKNKNRIEITTEEFNAGIDLLFNGTNTNFRKNAVIIILDKLDVYKNLGSIKRLIAELILLCENNKNTIYYKYHPRENQNLDELKNCIELDRNVAIEIYYKDCLPAKPLVIGIKSTGLQTAKKMGFEVVSLAKAADEHNEDVISFYKKIGISVPDNISQIRQLLS